jgi:hypothetical protein
MHKHAKISAYSQCAQAKFVQALSRAAQASTHGADIPTTTFYKILDHAQYNINPIEAHRLAETCPGEAPNSINYNRFLHWLEQVPESVNGRQTADRETDDLMTAAPWQVCGCMPHMEFAWSQALAGPSSPACVINNVACQAQGCTFGMLAWPIDSSNTHLAASWLPA